MRNRFWHLPWSLPLPLIIIIIIIFIIIIIIFFLFLLYFILILAPDSTKHIGWEIVNYGKSAMTVATLLDCVCVCVNCMFEWQCISSLYCNGNTLKQVDGLSSIVCLYVHCLINFFYHFYCWLILCVGHFYGMVGMGICVWRQVSGIWCISSPLDDSLHCRLQVPWIVDETLHTCLEL